MGVCLCVHLSIVNRSTDSGVSGASQPLSAELINRLRLRACVCVCHRPTSLSGCVCFRVWERVFVYACTVLPLLSFL